MSVLRRLPWRTFLIAFVLTLCVLGLFLAFFFSECRIRLATSGRMDLGVTYTLEDGAPVVTLADRDETIAVGSAVGQAVEVVVPPSLHLFSRLLRRENAIAQQLWEWVQEQL